MVFKSVCVEGFRGIHQRIEVPLNRVTMITGRNNVGKSSLLEAVAMAVSSLSGFRDALGNDFIKYLAKSKGLDWGLFIAKGSRESRISLEHTRGSVSIELKTSKDALDIIERLALAKLEEVSETEFEIAWRNASWRWVSSARLRLLPEAPEGIPEFKFITSVLRTLLLTAFRDDIDVSSALCNIISLDSHEEMKCLSELSSVGDALEKARDAIKNAARICLEELVKLVVTVSLPDYEVVYPVISGSDSAELAERVARVAYAKGLSRELSRAVARILIALARSARLSEVERLLRRMVILGDARVFGEAFLTAIARTMTKVVSYVVDEQVSRLRKAGAKLGVGMELAFVAHRDLRNWGWIGSTLDAVHRVGKGRVLSELLAQLGVESLWRDEEGRLLVTVDGGTLPMEAMGDGFLNLVRLVASHSLVDRGVVVVEEPETAMHPGYLALYAKILTDYVSREGRQVVFSTHSIELIDYVLEFAKRKSALEGVSVVLLRKRDGVVEPYVYRGPEAYRLRQEVYEELRGL